MFTQTLRVRTLNYTPNFAYTLGLSEEWCLSSPEEPETVISCVRSKILSNPFNLGVLHKGYDSTSSSVSVRGTNSKRASKLKSEGQFTPLSTVGSWGILGHNSQRYVSFYEVVGLR